MKYYILAEVRENYPSRIDGNTVYNDYVSRKSMDDFCAALNSVGYDCTFYGGMNELFSAYKNKVDISDITFINYNYGLPAPYKRTQCPTLLELMNARYSGSDPFVALLVNDKEFTKKVLRSVGILAPHSILVTNAERLQERIEESNISYPIVVKPNCEGSSLGITSDSLCTSYDKVEMMVRNLLPEFSEVIVEQYIAGFECTVWIIGNPGNYRVIAPLLISEKGNYYYKHKIFTMQDKANRVREYSLPEGILGESKVQEIKQIAEKIFLELGLRDYARFDFRISHDGIYFIEANALPIFSRTSEIGKIEQLYGLEYEAICKSLIESVDFRLNGKNL